MAIRPFKGPSGSYLGCRGGRRESYTVISGNGPECEEQCWREPLHIEVRRMRSRSLSVISMLLDAGADVNALSSEKHTPLSLALALATTSSNRSKVSSPSSSVWSGRSFWLSVVRHLVERGALWLIARSSELTPLHTFSPCRPRQVFMPRSTCPLRSIASHRVHPRAISMREIARETHR